MFYLDKQLFTGIRAKSLSSSSPPLLSGKSSPCPSYSGKSSPCPTIEENDINRTSRKKLLDLITGVNTVTQNKKNIVSTDGQIPPFNHAPTFKLDTIRLVNNEDICPIDRCVEKTEYTKTIQIICNEANLECEDCSQTEHPESCINNSMLVKCAKYCQTDLEDENLTLEQWRQKYENVEATVVSHNKPNTVELIEVNHLYSQKTNLINCDIVERSNKVEETQTQVTIPKSILPTIEFKKSQKYCSIVNRTPVLLAKSKSNTIINKQASISGRRVLTSRQKCAIANPNLIKSTNTTTIATNSTTTIMSNNNFKNYETKSIHPYKKLHKTSPTRGNQKNTLPFNSRCTNSVAKEMPGRAKTMIEISYKNSNTQNRSLKTVNVSQEDILSSTSTLKASREQIISSRANLSTFHTNSFQENSKSNPYMPSDEADGWLTVKVKRRSSLNWANRFNQPTGYASLPSIDLASREYPGAPAVHNSSAKKPLANKVLISKKENKKSSKNEHLALDQHQFDKDNKILDTNKQQSIINTNNKNKFKLTKESSVFDAHVKRFSTQKQSNLCQKVIIGKSRKSPDKISTNDSTTMVSRDLIVQRQKSDLTGIRVATLHKEYMRNVNHSKSKSSISNKEEPISNKKAELSNRETYVDMNIQTNMGLSKIMTDIYKCYDLENKFIKTHQDLSTSSCEEFEEKDDNDNDEDQRKLLEEQESLERQIRELENTEIDVDTETDETDCDVILDLKEDEDCLDDAEMETDLANISLEMRYQSLLSDMSLGERVETLATLQAFVSRHPGRAQQLHQKLSSPSRRRSLHETLKKYQAKQTRAQDKRESLNKEKAQKIQILLARVEDVKAAKQQLIEEKRVRMEERLQRAAENRTQYLKDKIRKAHDEEEKMKEIAFIKNLEAQNKRLDFIESWKEQEGRLQDLEQERQKRVEEKAAKEAAVEKRRLELEMERQRRLAKMNETRYF